ncbi:MAG: PAS domain-containing protein [Proteobacteria bacterium]|nr:PAS domain-containing protein [Pseudomonadota bacterium]
MQEIVRWDTFLIAEHELIERAMAVLKANLELVEQDGHEPLQLKRALDFLQEFGDKVHNVKEELFLFPKMQERGIPVQGGPLGVMLMEHEAERGLLGRMATTVVGLKEASDETRRTFVQEGLEYLTVRANHIWKENDVLYPMGRQVLSQADADALLASFRDLDVRVYGEGARQNYAGMVAEIEDAKVRKPLVTGLSTEQLHGIMEALPFEVTFVDTEDTVAYFNRLDKAKIFPRTRSVIGRKVENCHPGKSVDVVREIVQGFKDGTRDKAEFWIDMGGMKVMIRYFPVRDDNGKYLGVLEVTQDIAPIQAIKGQKRLLD